MVFPENQFVLVALESSVGVKPSELRIRAKPAMHFVIFFIVASLVKGYLAPPELSPRFAATSNVD